MMADATPTRHAVIAALELAQQDQTAVPDDVLVSVMRPLFTAGSPSSGVTRTIAETYELPARLYAALSRVVELFAPTEVSHLDPQAAALDDPDQERPEPGWDADGFQEFIVHAAHTLLTFDEEQALGKTISAGRLAAQMFAADPDVFGEERRVLRQLIAAGHRAEDELARHNMRLVFKVAFKQRHRCTPALEVEDLVDEGYIGLAHAIEKWDYTRGLKFSTYAMWWIRQTMERALANLSQPIRVPVHMQERIRTAWRARHELESKGLDSNDEAVAAKLGTTVEEIVQLGHYQRRVLSLDKPMKGDTAPLLLLLPDPRSESDNERMLSEIEDEQLIDTLLCDLTEREVDILTMHLALDGGPKRTLEEIGEEYGVTRERIRQIEAKAIEKLRSRSLKGWLGSGLHAMAERYQATMQEKD